MKFVKQFALTCAVALAVCGCSSATPTGSASTTTGATTTQSAATSSTENGKPAYAYLGYGAVENCSDLDIMATRKYYTEYTTYQATNYDGQEITQVYDVQEGYDLNNYTVVMKSQSGETLVTNASVNGKQVSAHYMSGYYEEGDNTSSYNEDRASFQELIATNDDSITGLEFVGTGTGAIPLTDDMAEYTYYEFKNVDTVDSAADDTTEDTSTDAVSSTEITRLYVKDDKLLAQVVELGGGQSTTVRLYHTITSKVPTGFIALPDTTGLTLEQN